MAEKLKGQHPSVLNLEVKGKVILSEDHPELVGKEIYFNFYHIDWLSKDCEKNGIRIDKIKGIESSDYYTVVDYGSMEII